MPIVIATIKSGEYQEAFGPWEVREDGSHMDEINAFVTHWQATSGKTETEPITLWLVTSPEAYDRRAAGS